MDRRCADAVLSGRSCRDDAHAKPAGDDRHILNPQGHQFETMQGRCKID
jgi:hypothetical protein